MEKHEKKVCLPYGIGNFVALIVTLAAATASSPLPFSLAIYLSLPSTGTALSLSLSTQKTGRGVSCNFSENKK